MKATEEHRMATLSPHFAFLLISGLDFQNNLLRQLSICRPAGPDIGSDDKADCLTEQPAATTSGDHASSPGVCSLHHIHGNRTTFTRIDT